MRKIIAPFFITIGFIACKSEHTTVIVYSKGPAEINSETKTIITKDGTGHEEKIIELAGKGFIYCKCEKRHCCWLLTKFCGIHQYLKKDNTGRPN
jgi:hypothetical protein